MLGIVHHAKAEFEKLSEVANVEVRPHTFSQVLTPEKFSLLTQFLNIQQVTSGSREEFIRDCDNGKYSNVVAISRTYDSVKVRTLLGESPTTPCLTDDDRLLDDSTQN